MALLLKQENWTKMGYHILADTSRRVNLIIGMGGMSCSFKFIRMKDAMTYIKLIVYSLRPHVNQYSRKSMYMLIATSNKSELNYIWQLLGRNKASNFLYCKILVQTFLDEKHKGFGPI